LPRYQRQQQYLDNTLRLVYNPGLFSSALLSITAPSSGFFTAVHPLDSEPYPLLIGQVYHSSASLSARLVFLAPMEMSPQAGYGKLLSLLTAQAGERGAVQVLAEVPRNVLEEDILYQAGFRVYAEQQIWKFPRRFSSSTGEKTWIPITRGDGDQIVSLYQRIVPGAVQRVEPPPTFPKVEGMICWSEGRVVGFTETRFGPIGILVDIILEPELSDIDEYLAALFYHLPYRNIRDVYLRIRSYQERIASALGRAGADPGPEQKAVVKRLAVHYNAKQTFKYQAFEKQPDITTPISNTEIKN
jgi:hypothetical protein